MDLIKLAEEAGLKPKWVALTQGDEYHSPCPACGGTDRFIMHPNKQMSKCTGSYFCRRCEIHGDSIEFCRKFLGFDDFKDAAEHAGATLGEKGRRQIMNIPSIPKNYNTPINQPSKEWTKRANKIVEEAHANILQQPEVLETLQQRGLPIGAVKLYKLGWWPKDKKENGSAWELEKDKEVWIPAGIVIPYIEKDGNVARLKIRRKDWKHGDELPKYAIITGSMNGLNIIGNKKNPIMVVVESELDAYALHYAANDIVVIVAIGGSTKNPDPVTDDLAKKKNLLLVCPDNDDTGKKVFEKWKGFYPYAKNYPTPFGKDIGEAIQQGLDVRSWIIKHGWDKEEDLLIIDWFLQYVKERTVTRESYNIFEKEIALGNNSPRAKTGELQKGLKLMRQLISESER